MPRLPYTPPRTATIAFVLAFVALVAAACDGSTGPKANRTLVLAFNGLEPLANGYHYEGWAIVGGQPRATGKFNANASGGLVTLTGAPITGGAFDTGLDLSTASEIVITVEPNGDTDAIPAATHLLAGNVASGSSALTVGATSALGSTFASAAGRYVLATPTNGAMNNENSGIWFMSLLTGSPTVGLTLPTLPAGWQYEGWAVIGGRAVTTGRFLSATSADLSAPFSGTMGGPPFPGEDYIMNAPSGLTFPTNLAGGTAVISVEPHPDDSPAPFTLKPLLANISASAVDHVTYSMGLNIVGFPTGTATIR